jgi:hypothetical protein
MYTERKKEENITEIMNITEAIFQNVKKEKKNIFVYFVF